MTEIYFSTILGSEESKMKMVAGWISLGLPSTTVEGHLLPVSAQRALSGRLCSPLLSLHSTVTLGSGQPQWPHFSLVTSAQALSLNMVMS